MPPDPKGGDDEAPAETERGCRHRLSRTDSFHPAPEDCRRGTEEKNGETKGPGQLRLRPIVGGGLRDPDYFGEGQLENAEGVNLTNRQMDSKGGWRHQPPAKSRPRYGLLPIEEAHNILKRMP